MATSFIPGLSFAGNDTFPPPPGHLVLLTDHLAAPAAFLLHRALVLCLKSNKDTSPDPQKPPEFLKPRVILVSFSQDFAYWSSIASKSNVHLQQHLKTGALAYIDGLPGVRVASASGSSTELEGCESYWQIEPPLDSGQEEASLRALYNAIAHFLRHTPIPDPNHTLNDSPGPASRTLIILDDITLLSYLGYPADSLVRFLRALRSLCARPASASTLLIRAHASPSPISTESTPYPYDEEVLRHLLEVCQTHVEVRPLGSGKSGAVSGEVAVHQGGAATQEMPPRGLGRNFGVQYRLGENGASFFRKGMSAGVL